MDILRVLDAFDYDVRTDGGGREQQFSCDLHGSGQDNKPSARVYPDSDSWYCFGCGVSRDAIQTVRDKLDKSFVEAVAWLEKTYSLPPLPFEEGDYEEKGKPLQDSDFQNPRTYEDERKRFETLLTNTTSDQSLPMRRTLTFWEAFDRVSHLTRKETMTEPKAKVLMVRLRKELMDEIIQEASA